MMDLLSTPGKDMHDTTTINSFHVTTLMPGGSPYNEQQALEIAARDEDEFDKFQSQLIYVDPRGKRMSRSEFKSTLRVSGKSVNFGILYGRGAKAIANQINAETGLGVTSDEIQQGIDGWHRTYENASAFFARCHQQALDIGWVANIWGRRRYFGRPENEGQKGNIMREAANHPIQGTVGDTMSLAIDRVANERNRRGLRMQIINQVHDALLFEVPEDNVDECVEVIRWGMSDIDLPMPAGPLRLEVDVDFYKRWGEKVKD
jgi:DNA polymerase-1